MGPFLLCGSLSAQASNVAARGTVRGLVSDALGGGVANAEVQWLPAGTIVRTNAEGRYVLSGVPDGRSTLRVRRIGFVSKQLDIDVIGVVPVIVDWRLERAPQQLNSIQVTARREPYDARLEGFRTRLEAKRGGYFITRSRIEQSGNRNLLDSFRGVPGVHIGSFGRGGRTVRFRSNDCTPLVFVDGFPASAADFDFDSIDLNMVEGIELYMSSSSVPPELFGPRGLEQCGVVAIWSRPAQLRTPLIRSTDERTADLVKRLASGQVMTADQVDSAAVLLSGELDVLYPEAFWRSGLEGQATVEFVIDDRGRMEWGTLAVVSATKPEFATAVTQALVATRWQAAVKGPTAVSQLFVLTVAFTHPK
ncbi:MAG: TonB-dependent receptor plug domain-containing protein [Gemmatimonas sp.]